MLNNVVGWFEIPVTDMDRAKKFYEELLRVEMSRHKVASEDMSFFPMVDNGLGTPGALVKTKDMKPSKDGVMIYITSPSGDLKNELDRVKTAGGEVVKEKTPISGGNGYAGRFVDTEGNLISIHSRR